MGGLTLETEVFLIELQSNIKNVFLVQLVRHADFYECLLNVCVYVHKCTFKTLYNANVCAVGMSLI